MDQTGGWFYSLHAISTLLFGEASFKNVISLGLILVWFIPWYLDRNTLIVWPVEDVFKTLGLGIASAVLYVVWDWARVKNHPP